MAEQKSISIPKLFLHVEGLGVFIAAVTLYIYLHASGWVFLLLILAPDLGMLGYLANPRVGATIYDIVHLEAIPLLLLVFFFVAGWLTILPLPLIWLAHIGMDRTFGYGLKYPTYFQDTHLSHV
jgi:hypothetical protein